MKTLIMMMISLTCQAQLGVTIKETWNKIPDDVKHHYASVGAALAIGVPLYRWTKRPFVSGVVGFGFAFAVTEIKEEWWDGKLGRGVKSIDDKRDGRWGATMGGFYVSAGGTICNRKRWEREYIDSLYFDMHPKDTIK